VTAILNVTHINHLLNAPYGPDLVRSGQKALVPVLNMFIKKQLNKLGQPRQFPHYSSRKKPVWKFLGFPTSCCNPGLTNCCF